MPIYIIENFEKLKKWVMIEYKNISKTVGRDSLWFTNVKRKNKELEKLGKVFKESVKDLNLDNACILDPEAPRTLEPKEAKKFNYFIFGGILGDYPPRKRTKEELTRFLTGEVRNIGKEQMSTDNAVFTVNQIVKGKKFKDLKFKDNIDIQINPILSLELPYRYNLVNGKPFMSKELIRFLKKKKGF